MMAMDNSQSGSQQWLFNRGVELLSKGDRLRAMKMFEKAENVKSTPECRSYLGMLTATERGLIRKGIEMCQSSIDADPENPVNYLNYSKLLYSVERKSESVSVIMRATKLGPSPEVDAWVGRVGVRKRPLFPFLTRSNPLNKYSGMMLRRFGLR